ncbi:TetR family transcriptional regulator [Gordonia sp. HY285]|uniref:TetR/AcrR family transcriptional regulator n=1 Tax=Gordonia liuliyuniae TaxID=2911517 RepID=UPI001F023C2D|nr:TetR family transcriptional regulator [Gordonia liuliyuniae]MCF8610154.1 TetR family transcriptional regulator [Gordonia liuliyuniae]
MGRRPLIRRETVARAAVDIVDEDGPAALSLERIASRLGVKAPSLYNHFADKTEIVEEAARTIVLETPEHADVVDGDWIGWLVEGAIAFRGALLAHARSVPLVVENFPQRLLERLYAQHCRVLHDHGVPVTDQMFIVEAVHRMTIGSAMCAATGRPAMSTPIDPDQFDVGVVESLASNDWDDDRLFVESVRTFLHGVRARWGR